MTRALLSAVVASACTVMLAGGCGSGPGPSQPAAGAPTSTTAAPATSGTLSAVSAGAQNLAVSPEVRSELLDAAAAVHGLPAGDFTGLVDSGTFYAVDDSTKALWAATSLLPGDVQQAQVSVQDDGGYTILTRPGGANGRWQGWDVGASGEPGGQCRVEIPAAVLAVWGWPAGSCLPPSGIPSGAPGPAESAGP